MEELSEYDGVLSPSALKLATSAGMQHGRTRSPFRPPLNRATFPAAFEVYNSAYWYALAYMAIWDLSMDGDKKRPRERRG